MKVKSDEVEGTLRHDNEALMSTLESCQKSQAPGATPTLSVAEATKKDVVCETKLRERGQMYDANQEEQHQMASTVNLLTRENEDLKGKVSKTNAANCPACPSCVDLASATVDVAHMAETTKIDSYISQSEGELAELPHEAKRLVEAAKPAPAATPAATPSTSGAATGNPSIEQALE